MMQTQTLPPGSRQPSWVQTARLIHDAESFLRRGVERFGDPFTARIRGGNVVFTGRPELLRTVFAAPSDVVAPYAPAHIASVLGPHALILLTGSNHKHERALLAPLFHGAQVETWSNTIVDVTRRTTAGLPDGAFSALDLCQRIALDVVLRIIFGFDNDERHQQALAITLDFIAAIHPLAIFFDALTRRVPALGQQRRWQTAAATLDAFLLEVIAERRRAIIGHSTVLDVLISMQTTDGDRLSDANIADELRTFLVTGHETTAGAMAWALDAIHRDAAVEARLRDELGTVAPDDHTATARLPYLGAVVDEALRLYPVIPFVPKQVAGTLELDGQRLPAGTGIFVATALAHMNPDVFPEPERFLPERFLQRRPTALEYFPFGGGAKRCLASGFAVHEMRLVLATLLRHHRFAPIGSALRPVHHGITRGPSRRAPLVKLHNDG